MNHPRLSLPEGLLDGFDADLQAFYHEALAKELDPLQPGNAEDIRHALKTVANAYKKETVESCSSCICFDSPEKRCAYVMKHCPCFTSAAARHFLRLLLRNPSVLDLAIHKRQVNLCCLGGGPATDAVAIAKVISSVNDALMIRNREKLHLRVCVVDLNEEWRTTASLVLQTLVETRRFFDSRKMTLDFRFLTADLTDPWRQQVRKALSEADIVTTVYFVSAVIGSQVKYKCIETLQNVMEVLKPGALLFFLDSSKDIHYDMVLSAASSFENMKQIYGPYVQLFHRLSMSSIRKFIELYFYKFNAVLCLTNCFITACSWTKASSPDIRSHRVWIPQRGRIWNKRVARNTRKQTEFREKVENLVLSELNMHFRPPTADDFDSSSELSYPVCDKKTLYASKSKRKRIHAWPE